MAKKAKSVAVRLKRGVIYWGDKRKIAGQVFTFDVVRTDGIVAAEVASNLRSRGYLVRITEGTNTEGKKVWLLWTRRKKARKRPGKETKGWVSSVPTYRW